MYSAPFARLARHPRMIEPVVEVFGEPVYMHQFKINGKMAFDGDVWQWHQDFGTWFNDDQMPEARAMNVAIFLDDVNEFNGPLMFIPGSHKLGVLDAGHDTTTTSYPLWTIDHATIARLVARGGLVAPKGPAGSMIMFHSCLVHASTSNLSPWNRVSVYLSLCAVSNHIRRFKRPEYIAHHDVAGAPQVHQVPELLAVEHDRVEVELGERLAGLPLENGPRVDAGAPRVVHAGRIVRDVAAAVRGHDLQRRKPFENTVEH